MIRGFYSAAAGLASRQDQLNVIANNMANVNTTGFKAQQSNFSALLYQSLNGGAGNSISVGHGSRLAHTGTVFTQGELKRTDGELDCAIIGQGFFAVESQKDEMTTYSRDGSFKIGKDGNKSYLVNSAGDYVLDAKEKKIEINDSFDLQNVGVFTFLNPGELKLLGGNQFAATELSGDAEIVKEPKMVAGHLENSSVQLAEEMVKMIEATKGFSFNSKIIQAADEMEKTVNQLR
jgi:flagellar basal body rod protein FlgG